MCLNQLHYNCRKWKRAPKNGYSEYIAVDNKCVINIDAQDDDLEYVLVEPLNVAINLVKRISPSKDDKIAIIGNGSIGLLAVFYLSLIGCNNVSIYARTPVGIRSQVAEIFGAKTYCYSEAAKEGVSKANKIINTAPYNTMSEIINYANPFSTITFNGISENTRVLLDMDVWHFKNITISPSFPHPQDTFFEAVKVMKLYKENLKLMITHVFPLNDISLAYELMKYKKEEYIKILISGQQSSIMI